MSEAQIFKGDVLRKEYNDNLGVEVVQVFVRGRGVYIARTPFGCELKGDTYDVSGTQVKAILIEGRSMGFGNDIKGQVKELNSGVCNSKDCPVWNVCFSKSADIK